MFGIGGFELFLILLFAFLIFGPDKLPQLAKTLGVAIRKFRDAQDEVNRVVKTEIYDPLSENPVKDPLAAIDKENRQKAEKKESFAARKAKYDQEREARLKREAANAAALEERAAVRAEAAERRDESEGASISAAEVHERVMGARKKATEQAEAESRAARIADRELADEIFGVKKPGAPKKTASAQKEEN